MPKNYTNVRNAGSETEWLKPVYLGEQLATRSCLVDIVARQGRAGSGFDIQEEQILTPTAISCCGDRHTMALFPETKLGKAQKE